MTNFRFSIISNDSEWQQCFAIRKSVFVIEQQVSESLEMDGKENDCLGFLVYQDDKAIATCRCRMTHSGYKIERFAVLKECRQSGVGELMLQEVLNYLQTFNQRIYLNAQEQVVDYYGKRGFKVCSNVFEEAGIRHYEMEFQI